MNRLSSLMLLATGLWCGACGSHEGADFDTQLENGTQSAGSGTITGSDSTAAVSSSLGGSPGVSTSDVDGVTTGSATVSGSVGGMPSDGGSGGSESTVASTTGDSTVQSVNAGSDFTSTANNTASTTSTGSATSTSSTTGGSGGSSGATSTAATSTTGDPDPECDCIEEPDPDLANIAYRTPDLGSPGPTVGGCCDGCNFVPRQTSCIISAHCGRPTGDATGADDYWVTWGTCAGDSPVCANYGLAANPKLNGGEALGSCSGPVTDPEECFETSDTTAVCE